jgi:hypothetical protein
MLGSIFISRSVKELQKYVPQVRFWLIKCMLGSIFISRSVKELQKYVPQVGFLGLSSQEA